MKKVFLGLMPLECGIDFGAKLLGPPPLNTKRFLILEKEKFRYQKFISDIAGNDIRAHQGVPELAIKCVRDWLRLNNNATVAHTQKVWLDYTEFLYDYVEYAKKNNFNPHLISEITFADLIELMKEWVKGLEDKR
jgi:hypothetical protein